MSTTAGKARTFKSKWFTKAARKAAISDDQLCQAIQQVMAGQADDLGGGVWKKRVDDNRQRSIILARGGVYWVYEYLFAKKDRENIEDDELLDFRRLAKLYAGLQAAQVNDFIVKGHWTEICHER